MNTSVTPSVPNPAPLLSTSDVARRLGVTGRHVRRLILAGKLPAIEVGSGPQPVYRVSPNALRLFLERGKTARRR